MIDFKKKPVIACIHLLPTVGSHRYDGDVEQIYKTALWEARAFIDHGVDALIVENFRDGPFFPAEVPAETIATLAGVTREIVKWQASLLGLLCCAMTLRLQWQLQRPQMLASFE